MWAYCKLINPEEAFLLSPMGLGSLNKLINLFGREDLLDFGDGKKIKKMQIGKWDISKNGIDFHSLIPIKSTRFKWKSNSYDKCRFRFFFANRGFF